MEKTLILLCLVVLYLFDLLYVFFGKLLLLRRVDFFLEGVFLRELVELGGILGVEGC